MFESVSLFPIVLAIIVCFLIHRLIFNKRKYDPPLPPSPGAQIPVIGHFHLLDMDMRQPLKKLRKKCGDIYSLQMGSIPSVVISGYDAVKDGFKIQDLFTDRRYMYVLDKVTRGGKGIGFARNESWKENRRFTLSTLKDFGMGKSILEGEIHEETKYLLEEVGTFEGRSFDPHELLAVHVSNIIFSLVFKGSFKYTDPRFKEMIKMLDENMRSSSGVANFFPWAARIPGDFLGVSKTFSNAEKIYEFCENIIKEHVESYDENCIDDLTSAYIKQIKRFEENGESTTMNYEFLAGLIADLFFAGSETSTTALRWALVFLVEYPEMQERMFSEIEAHVGTSRLPSVKDRTVLTYVEAFYTEILRFCDLAIVGGFHSTPVDVVFRGYTIPANTLVIPDLSSVHSDPKIWGDPETFRPERFLDDSGNIVRRDEFMAFMIGKRSCVGESLARMEMFLFLSALVQNFKFESPPGTEISFAATDGQFGSAHCPKPYKIVAKARL
ncbi:cytochrome P450 2C15-like [Mya arenaria]|uniref:cytochrome P450 2C15-like n=1 Tax=Mya arenaria TaxID=6604 RepID=UPI0022E35F9E|nr:cytochrome P450 2C15-like [Mya arenaria]